MARKEPVNKALEARRRLRELAKYYCATASLPKPRSSVDEDANTLHDEIDLIKNYRPAPVQLSIDHNLTALCQLGALRADCARCFVSILDDRTQHVIAEATRTVSCFNINNHAPGDELILGMQSFPMGFGICSTTIGLFTGECQVDFDGSGTIANQEYICIPDLFAEKATRTVPAIQGTDIMRYYLEVPLRNSSGYVVGSICVIDPAVRTAAAKDIEIMQEMAKLVMAHLEMTRMKEDHRRTERLLDGLAHFIKGKESICQSSSARGSTEETPETISKIAISAATILGNGHEESRSDGSADNGLPARIDATSTSNTLSRKIDPQEPMSSANGVDDPRPGISRSSTCDDDDAQVPVGVKTKHVFARAANLLRQSMDLDACCFIEVPQNERFKTVDQRKASFSQKTRTSGSFSSASQSQESSDSSGDEIDRASVSIDMRSHKNGSDVGKNEVLCHRLGFSARAMLKTSTGNRINNESLTVPALVLSDLAARYPQGNIFHFDSVGSVSSSSDEQGGQPSGTKSAKKRLASKLFKHFPKTSSLVFLPLYDNDRQHVYAGFLGWTTDPERGLQKSELIYVAGFANSIMCEVMRLEAQATDKAKSDFISSISHELRSPLHGILAASQLLVECKPSAKQVEYLGMIDTCGRTLLDIMNHLLDHAKINHFTKGSRKRLKQIPKTPGLDAFSLTNDLNLLTLVEETASSMSASSNHFGNLPNGVVHFKTHARPVPIILTIHPSQMWNFSTEPGSWRRIIMNLVGNSIKYTQEGHIGVDLKLRQRHHHRSKSTLLAELRVADTGQGISEEYLKHRLYTPFAQENNLSVGAGLGLSLVQKIVSSLSGNIHIQSEVGVGTEVTVTIPLEESSSSDSSLTTDAESGAIRSTTSGKTVQFVGFEVQDLPGNDEQAVSGREAGPLSELKHSLTSTLTDWFDLKIVSSEADILVIEETHLEKDLKSFDRMNNRLLVTGAGIGSSVTDKLQNARYVRLYPPTGPIRLSQALKDLLKSDGPDREKPRIVQQSQTHKVLDIAHHPLIPEDKKQHVSDLNEARKDDDIATNMANAEPSVGQAPVESIEPQAPAIDSPKQAILLVDDNDINLRILTACVSRLDLQKQNMSYITATNGQEALDRYVAATKNNTQVGVVFMDISMPIMDGFASTREIRAYEKSHGVPASKIIALTGLASAEAQSEIEACGFDLYLRKPVNLKTVRDILKDERK